MKLHEDIWNKFANLTKTRLLSKYDPALLVPDPGNIVSKLKVPHCGFYITVYDSKQKKVVSVGFLEKNKQDILVSSNTVVDALYTELEAKGVSSESLPVSSFSFVVVWDLIFMKNALAWNENTDGVYFSWGDRYKSIYLPHEIIRMSSTKVEILNRLCSWEAGVPSNLWRLPEGRCYKMVADSYSI